MDCESLIRVRLHAGRYEGVLTCTNSAGTGIEAVHEGRVIAAATLSPDDTRKGSARAIILLPAEVIGEGIQIITLRSTATGAVLDRITLMAGAALDEDIRLEIALLRDELEMLKRAFRRHVSETVSR
jgi:hypothetical protein